MPTTDSTSGSTPGSVSSSSTSLSSTSSTPTARNRRRTSGEEDGGGGENDHHENRSSCSICDQISHLSSHLIAYLVMSIIWTLSFFAWPVSFVVQTPWNKLERMKRIRATRENLADPNSPYYRIGERRELHLAGIDTIPHAQKRSFRQLDRNARALGFREVLELKQEYSDPEAKYLRKFVLTDYKWLTYGEVDARITTLEKAFRSMQVRADSRVLVFAETRVEWFLCAHAIIRTGAAIATLFPTLGDEGLRHGITETGATVLITSEDLLERLPKPLPNQIRHLVYFPTLSVFTAKPEQISKISSDVECLSYAQLLARGENSSRHEAIYDPNATTIVGETPAMILYTSGSTGKPKGVILTHKNIVSTMKGIYSIIPDRVLDERDRHGWYAFLPLAHVLEFIAENALFCVGFRIGYGSPHTMTDLSTGILRGQPGDLTLLKPTIIPGVPLVLERIRKTIMQKLQRRSAIFTALAAKLCDHRTFWQEHGYDTPIFDALISGRFRRLFGGNVEYMLIGGAALSGETQRMMRALLNVQIIIGYGSTETCGANLLMDLEDSSIGWTGAPMFGIKARLVDWREGGYTVADRPNPRGELHIGGDSVSAGYFAQTEQTEESFYAEKGVQWFRTGDIVEVNRLGNFRIVDRKKDLIKLPHGEFVSLGKIETELKNCYAIDNVCVHADVNRSYVVALIMPNWNALKPLAIEFINQQHQQQQQKDGAQTIAPEDCTIIDAAAIERLRVDARFVERVKRVIQQFCRTETRLSRVEIPERIYLCAEEWSPANDLLTAAMKIKRINIARFYARQIESMYAAQ